MPESEDALQMLIRDSGIAPDSEISRRLQTYLELLKKWNSRINLTSSTDWNAIGPFFQEGLWASKLYTDDAVRHLDIGSGAGFPAVLLKILKPQIQLDLVESRAKKGIFLETVASALKSGGIRVHAMRLQAFLQQNGRNQFWDCISWKGLKLSNSDLQMLLAHARAATQFWMFHGSELAVEEPTAIERYFRHFRTERLSGRRLWALSIYLPK
jgi:16S rRNA (guanine527-N7)-methyltransferase